MAAIRIKNFSSFQIFKFLPILLVVFAMYGCGTTPYSSKFSCPPTYSGLCESPVDAYNDSVNNIDPRTFDPEWQKKRKKWEEKNRALLEARKQAIQSKTESLPDEAPDYRQELFTELKNLLKAPQTPILIPPKVVRALVLGSADEDVYVAPHYVFFMLDQPRWVLRKIPEKIINRRIKSEEKSGSGKAKKSK